MSDPMGDVIAARAAYVAAREQVTATRLRLGQAILEARQEGLGQTEIADRLKLTREQIRRYQVEYEKFLRNRSAQS